MGSRAESENRLAVVVVVDGLRASALGTYGNTMFPTPLFDELASRSAVVEWLFSNGPTLDDFYRTAVPKLDNTGLLCRLLTDDSSIASKVDGEPFAELLSIEPGRDASALELAGTHAANFFSQSFEQLTAWRNELVEQQKSGLLWIHFSGLSGPWDAPLVMRRELLEDDELTPPEFVVPPAELKGIDDPDVLLGYRVAYAAQISVIESCLAGFWAACDELPWTGPKLVMLIGSRGFALGEHGSVGYDCQSLYSEQLHLPWFIKGHEMRGPLPRVGGFAQPSDVAATLANWFGGDEPHGGDGRTLLPAFEFQLSKLREIAFATNSAGESMIRTPAWQMIRGDATQLYAKPDDRWEANDVATRCPDIVADLCKHLETQSPGPGPLAEELTSPWR